jgi:ribosome-associated translation inhibitor RaiA
MSKDNINIVINHFNSSIDLNKYIGSKMRKVLRKLPKKYAPDSELNISLSYDASRKNSNTQYSAHARINLPHKELIAHSESFNPYALTDIIESKLSRLLSDYKSEHMLYKRWERTWRKIKAHKMRGKRKDSL